jgi:hypothetical protein
VGGGCGLGGGGGGGGGGGNSCAAAAARRTNKASCRIPRLLLAIIGL